MLFALIILIGCHSDSPTAIFKNFDVNSDTLSIISKKQLAIDKLSDDSMKIYAIDGIVWEVVKDTSLEKVTVSEYLLNPESYNKEMWENIRPKVIDGKDQLYAYYNGTNLVKLHYSPELNVFTNYFFFDGQLIFVEEGCLNKAMSRCGTYSNRMQYFINNKRFYKIIGRKFYHTEIKPQGEAKNEKDDCWCLSREDEDKIVLDQLTRCLNRIGNERIKKNIH